MRAVAITIALFALAGFPTTVAAPQSASYAGAAFTTGACEDSTLAACFLSPPGALNMGIHVIDTVQAAFRGLANDPRVPPGLGPVADKQGACIQVTLVGIEAPTLHGCGVVIVSPIPGGVTGYRVAFEAGPSPDGECICVGMAGNVLASTF